MLYYCNITLIKKELAYEKEYKDFLCDNIFVISKFNDWL